MYTLWVCLSYIHMSASIYETHLYAGHSLRSFFMGYKCPCMLGGNCIFSKLCFWFVILFIGFIWIVVRFILVIVFWFPCGLLRQMPII